MRFVNRQNINDAYFGDFFFSFFADLYQILLFETFHEVKYVVHTRNFFVDTV